MFNSSTLEIEDFSVASFLNTSLDITTQTDVASDETYEERLQRRMAELALHLQVQTQKCHDDIGRVATELRGLLPRCAGDMTRIGVGLQGLRDDASGLLGAHVQANLPHHPLAMQYSTPVNVLDESSNPLEILETLSTLHALQENLEKTKGILEAAASWDSILSSIPPLIASSNLSEAVSAWMKLQEGSRELQPLPGREKREETIHGIRDEILALLKPQLHHALQRLETRLGPLQKCVSLYHSLGTLENLKEEYVKSRPTSIHRLWFDFVSNSSKEIHDTATPLIAYPPSSTTLNIWLPTWYDAVSALLNEERTRTLTVFGPNLVPEVLIRILQECFRPILTSMRTRLSTCYPSDADEQGSDVIEIMGSFDTISTAYEITVRFLSDIYELLTPVHAEKNQSPQQHILNRTQSDEFTPSIVSSVPSITLSRYKLYTLVQNTFAYVASPFVPYQINFAALELQHSSIVSKRIMKDLQLFLDTRTVSTMTLRKAADMISEMTPSVLPLAQAALTRFELFNCGYWAPNALSTVDVLLSRHVDEIVVMINALSKSILNVDVNKLSSISDEQSFQSSLDILKNVGALKRDISIFMGQVSEHMRSLSTRMAKAKEYHTTSKGNYMPEELSAHDIHLLLAKFACANKHEDDRIGIEILVSLAEKEHGILFPELSMSMRKLIHSSQTFVCDICSILPRNSIRSFSTLTVWSNYSNDDSFMAESFGNLPQTLITQIGEHLLSLVQIFEPFALDPAALSLGNTAMENISDIPLTSWNEFVETIGYDQDRIQNIMSGNAFSDLDSAISAIHLENENDEGDTPSTLFCNQWLDVISSTLTAALLNQTMKIPKLSRMGCEQLVVDFGYLMNVLSALGLSNHPHQLLNHIAEVSQLSDDEFKARLVQKTFDLENVVDLVDRRLAQMRNISL